MLGLGDITHGIIHNLALLLALGMLLDLLRYIVPGRAGSLNKILTGVVFGGIAIFTMATAFVFAPGVFLDGRAIIIALAGLFSGGTTGIVAMAMAGIYCGMLGGPGMWADLAMILVAGGCGILGRRVICRSNWPPTVWQLWLTGIIVHALVLACMLLLPATMRFAVIASLAIPFLLFYPLVMLCLGMIMVRIEEWSLSLSRLQHAEWLFNEAQNLTRYGSWEYWVATDKLTTTPNFCRLLDLPVADEPLALQDLFGRLHPEDWDIVRQAFDSAFDGKDDFDVQARLTTDAGRELWIRMVGKPIVRKGKVTQLIGNLIDITRRKTSELELQARESQLQAILDHSPALICICDLDGDILMVNRRFNVFGGDVTQMPGRPLYEVLPRGGAVEQWLDDFLALQAGKSVEFEETLLHFDGTTHPYLTTKFLLAATADRQTHICYIALDISELRQALDERQELTAELQAKNDELERFTYSVSHDLKAPLLTVGSYSDMLVEDLAAGRNAQVTEDLGFIRDAVGKMRRLIDGLLELSRLSSGIGEIAPIDLKQLLAETLLLIDGELRKSGGQVRVAPDLPIVAGDLLRLHQVMQNLLQNALKFGKADCPVQVDVDWVRQSDGGVLVTVSDNGRGIATSELGQMFDLFVKGSHGETGAGVGLALVRRIMEMHGGSVSAESAGPGTGSMFSLRFPPRSTGENR